MRSNRYWFIGWLTLSIALPGAVGCLGEDDLEIASDEEVTDYYIDEGSIEVAVTKPTLAAEGGEDELAGCVRVEYCQHPDPVLGTTCIWDACTFQAAWAECDVDGRYVCGRINPVKGMRR